MPFATAARLELANEGDSVIDPVFYQVTYYDLPEPPRTGLRFHACWRREDPAREGAPYTVLEAQGAGHYAGCHLYLQNRERWLRWPPRAALFPYGGGLGMLEGWENIYVDGEKMPSVSGTGTEDYFGGAWYFRSRFTAPEYGCTMRDYVRGRVAAYRFDVTAPVPFDSSIRVTLDHGFENCLQADYTSVAFWYQSEPHEAFVALPPPSERKPSPATGNILQAAAAAGLPLLAGYGLARRLLSR
jgi:hypothetical protein